MDTSSRNQRLLKVAIPIAIYLAGLSLRLWYVLPSSPPTGTGEYSAYLSAIQSGYHSIDLLLNYCLFTTLIPALLQKVTGIDPLLLFKLYICVVVAVLPVIVYLTSIKYVSRLYALIATSYIMIQISFIWVFDLNRVSIALVFLSLIPLILLSGMRLHNKVIWLIPVLCCIVLSHYGVTFATIFVLGIGLVVILVSKLKVKKPTLAITGTLVVLVILSGVWYRTSEGLGQPIRYGADLTYSTMLEKGSELPRVTERIGQAQVVDVAFGKTLPDMNVAQKIEFGISWLAIILMTLGLFRGIRKGLFPCKEYGILAGVAYITICLAIVSPEISHYYGVTRTYYQMLIPLAVCLPIGGEYIAEKVGMRTWILIVPLVIIQGLCIHGVIHHILGVAR